ncbi:hypothetical protein [Ruegeria sp. HKCCA5763]|uniref:hypothetical protein n=1 Tax=Ruegeria sp. HKCCA5763 TaxID=2682987 RepID=UPI0020C32969|nr:hypothetical protein [Ruegeria sp. HKCCA5763]
MMTRRSLFVKAAATGAALTLAGTTAAVAGGAKKKGSFGGPIEPHHNRFREAGQRR